MLKLGKVSDTEISDIFSVMMCYVIKVKMFKDKHSGHLPLQKVFPLYSQGLALEIALYDAINNKLSHRDKRAIKVVEKEL